MPQLRRAFTLIELLVVIAIIGVLLAILVPVLASARESVYGVNCLSNQRQLMIAVTAHAADHRGQIPFGPVERDGGVASGLDDLYIINGMPTSLISDKFGRVIGAGTLLSEYLADTPQVMFCPGADQPVVVSEQLDRVGRDTAIGGYIYRHNGSTFTDLENYQDRGVPMDQRTQLDNLGTNANGDAIQALFIDNNFIVKAHSFDYFHRSNHNRNFTNIAYADGHAEQRANVDSRYEVNIVGTNLINAIDQIMEVFEAADVSE